MKTEDKQNHSLEQFKDLIGLFNTWEELENVCEKTIGVGIVLIDAEGNFIAQRQQESKFCQLIQSSKIGYSRCQTSYLKNCFSKKAIEKGFCLFKCHAGLTNLSIPISVGEIPLTALVSGGVLDKPFDLQLYKKYAQELNLDTKSLITYLKEVKIVSDKDIISLTSTLLPLIDTLKDGLINHYHLVEKNQYLDNLIKETEKQLKIDELTSFLTKRAFLDYLHEEIVLAKNQHIPLSLLIADIDNFRLIRNTYGLSISDKIIKELATFMKKNLPEEIISSRYDTDIFGIIFKASKEEVESLGRDFQLKVKNYIFGQEDGLKLSLSISIGIANLTKNIYSSQGLIKEAMKKVLTAKMEGGDRVVIRYTKPYKRRVVITGLGVISPIGIGKETFWKALGEGKSGISWISSFDTSSSQAKIAGEVKDFNPADYINQKTIKRIGRATQFGIAATYLALQDAKLEINKEKIERIGVFIGGGVGGLTFAENQVTKYVKEGADKVSPFLGINIFGGALSSEISLELGLKGPSITISTGCPAGTDAIGYAFNSIKNGECELTITGGTEAPIRPVTLLSFIVMGALSTYQGNPEEASRPFDARRDGFVMGEGAGILILEELNHALNRGAHIYAEIVGYAATTDAYHMVAPLPDGRDLTRAINLALKEANLKPKDIDYINAHGSSTPLGDSMETSAIKNAFLNYAYKIPISGTKSMLGHSIGATGAVETIICALAIENRFIPPTINYKYPDPNCDLDYVPNIGRKANINVAMSNSIGFGGKNSSMILQRLEMGN